MEESRSSGSSEGPELLDRRSGYLVKKWELHSAELRLRGLIIPNKSWTLVFSTCRWALRQF